MPRVDCMFHMSAVVSDFPGYTSPMNHVPVNRLVGIFEALNVANRSVAEVLEL